MDVNQAGMDRGKLGNRSTGGDNMPSGSASDLTGQTKQAVTQTAQETVETAKTAGKEIADTVQEQVAQVVDQAVTQTADTVAQVKEQASSVFVDQRDRAIAGLSGLADALRETGRTLSEQTNSDGEGDQSPAMAIAPLIEEIADRLASSSDFLKDKDVRQLIDDAENLARRQPMLFVGALFAVGVVGARLLKGTIGSSDEDAQKDAGNSESTGWNAGTGWATPENDNGPTAPNATSQDSAFATDFSGGSESLIDEPGLNADRPSFFGTGTSSLTGNQS